MGLPGGRKISDHPRLVEQEVKALRDTGRKKVFGVWLPDGAKAAEAWTLPLGISSVLEMGASRQKSELIHHICRADSSASQDPWSGLLMSADSLTGQPRSPLWAWPHQLLSSASGLT